ncbi:PTS fructose transporter subunit IIA [Shouchella clausii]|uniref:BglG family transcription antiterminator n=1 Tax=Shouchella tritolerans TaxID=2979466 RepID=UPI001B2D00C1|nr:PTS sugar transporter subunit IIA [Shouchella tritolerans]GIN12817.1 PTS fructose transporter subunit IIA [Shouchella clausii]
MKEVQRKLILILASEDRETTSQNLADKLHISKRSVKDNIRVINKKFPGFIISSNVGYLIDKSRVDNILYQSRNLIPETPDGRFHYIIKKVLLSDIANKSGNIDIYDLSEELNVSEATIYKDLAKIRRHLTHYELGLETKNEKIVLSGSQRMKQKAINNLYFSEVKDKGITFESVQLAYPNYNVNVIANVITRLTKKYHYFMNHYSVVNIVMYIIIGMERIKNDFYSNIEAEIEPDIDFSSIREITLVSEISKELESLFNITYNSFELKELRLLILSNIMSSDYHKLNEEMFQSLIGEETLHLVELMLKDLREYFYFDEYDNSFFRQFSLHINNMLLRLKANYVNKNPMTEHIKYTTPFLFDCAVQMSNTILNHTGYNISDDEIAYIVLHLGAIIDYHEKLKNKFNAAVIFPDYYNFASKFVERIEEFNPDITVSNLFTSVDQFLEMDNKPFDLVISTLSFKTEEKLIVINPLLTSFDISILKREISNLKGVREHTRLKKLLSSITEDKFFMINPPVKHSSELIALVADTFEENDIVTKKFKQEVINRENLSSTAWGKIAVPHSLEMNALKTKMFISIFDKPIPWGETNVNLVLLFAINEETKGVFREVFDKLIVLLTEEKKLSTVLSSRSLQEFIERIL